MVVNIEQCLMKIKTLDTGRINFLITYNVLWLCEVPPIREYKEDEFQDASIYKTNIDDIITDCLCRLNDWHKGLYDELNEIVPRETQFHRELSSLLNKYSKENGSNTPDKELVETNRPSFNNMVETILVSYFKAKGEKNKNVTTNANSE
jgi:hypothetical protein